MGIQAFERRLERLVEGAFARAFRSGVEPVELGRRIVREQEARRTLGVRGTVVPNEYLVRLASDDHDQFAAFADALTRELSEAAREHARGEGYHFVGPVRVTLQVDERLKRGSFRVEGAIVATEGGGAALVTSNGDRVPLGEEPVRIGRMPDCAVMVTDPQVSRHHAEVRAVHDGFAVVDLGSTNGTRVNGAGVAQRVLADGDEIQVGSTVLSFEEA